MRGYPAPFIVIRQYAILLHIQDSKDGKSIHGILLLFSSLLTNLQGKYNHTIIHYEDDGAARVSSCEKKERSSR